jgi:hypothetical protein
MATYSQIQRWVKWSYGFTPKTCWIAHCKEIYGLPVRNSPNRQGSARMVPCPPEKRSMIKAAFEHFGMLSDVA